MRTTLLVGGLAAVQIAASILTQIVVLVLLGPGRETDAFIAAQTFPMVLVSIASASLQSAWQPRLSRAEGEDRVALVRQLFTQSVVIASLMALAVLVATPLIGRIAFGGFDESSRSLFRTLSLITAISIPFNVVVAAFVPVFRAQGRFVASEGVPAAAFFAGVAVLPFAVAEFGIFGAALASLGRAMVAALSVWLVGGRPLPTTRWPAMPREMGPLLAGASLYKTGPIIDRYWGAHAPSGEMTLFSLVQTGLTAAAAVVERMIGGPAQPRFAVLWAKGDVAGFRKAVRRASLQTWMILAACTAALFIVQGWAPVILGTLLNLERARSVEVMTFSWALLGFFYVGAAGGIPASAFYALGDVRTPVVVGTIGFFAGALLKILGYTRFGLAGVGVSASAYYLANYITTSILLDRKIRSVESARSGL